MPKIKDDKTTTTTLAGVKLTEFTLDTADGLIEREGIEYLPSHLIANAYQFQMEQIKKASENGSSSSDFRIKMPQAAQNIAFYGYVVQETEREYMRQMEYEAYVVLKGKIFEVGKWPERSFTLNADEMDFAIEEFVPVFFDYGHVEGPLDGALGVLRKIWKQDKDLWGEAIVPYWLDEKMKQLGSPRKVSCTWLINEPKLLVGIAHVKHPGISDALLRECYSRLSEAGNGTGNQNQTSTFVGRRNRAEDQAGIEAIHSMSVSLGASCICPNCAGAGNDDDDNNNDEQSNNSRETTMYQNQQNNNGGGSGAGANGGAGNGSGTNTGENTQHQQSQAQNHQQNQQQFAGNSSNTGAAVVNTSEIEARFAEMERQLALRTKEVAEFQERVRKQDAAAYVDAQIAAGQFVPAVREELIKFVAQLMKDDQADPTPGGLAQFGKAQLQASRAGALQAIFNLLPGYIHLQREAIATTNGGNVGAGNGGQTMQFGVGAGNGNGAAGSGQITTGQPQNNGQLVFTLPGQLTAGSGQITTDAGAGNGNAQNQNQNQQQFGAWNGNGANSSVMSPEKLAEYLSKTSLGVAVLNEKVRRQGGNGN